MKQPSPATVAVIFSAADLERAITLRVPPDLFELRLDALAPAIARLEEKAKKLRAPLIITARHPSEGGANRLRPRTRDALLRQFLPYATFIDVELRSGLAFADLLLEARKRSIRLIISLHNLTGTPTARHLDEMARTAGKLNPDILKVATRTDSPTQFARLRDFAERHRGAQRLAVMGIGKLGSRFREEFSKTSVLNYVHLGKNCVDGQLSLDQLQRLLRKT